MGTDVVFTFACERDYLQLLHDFPSIHSDERGVDLIDAACDGRMLAEALHQL